MLQVEKNVFDEWVTTHKKAKGLYGAPFPHYDTLVEIYAKDKATGDVSESFVGAINNMDVEFANEPLVIESDEEDDANSVTHSGKRPMKKEFNDPTPLKKTKLKDLKGKGKGQSKVSDVDGLASSIQSVSTNFQKIFENINANLGTMACAWAKAEEREQKLDDKANKVLEEVMKLDGLSPSEALEVATILMAEEHKRHIFYQAPMNLRRQYVIDLLKKK
ncbi:uncharacterized protein LOC131022301 [Salvia miltiorrhiza]|uniref:uncharacterized protein LOC131022301 n=1 Tax=Salvia miltiorrhiza TaxID=226208 RepID=UPI0025AC7B24|nr:uncharacterized protein LOC131022301 [Salvia miltiorrhiza]